MAITIGDKTFRTLDQDLLVNGRKVTKAYVVDKFNKTLVYPEYERPGLLVLKCAGKETHKGLGVYYSDYATSFAESISPECTLVFDYVFSLVANIKGGDPRIQALNFLPQVQVGEIPYSVQFPWKSRQDNSQIDARCTYYARVRLTYAPPVSEITSHDFEFSGQGEEIYGMLCKPWNLCPSGTVTVNYPSGGETDIVKYYYPSDDYLRIYTSLFSNNKSEVSYFYPGCWVRISDKRNRRYYLGFGEGTESFSVLYQNFLNRRQGSHLDLPGDLVIDTKPPSWAFTVSMFDCLDD